MDKIPTPHIGLTSEQAHKSRLQHGCNELTPRPRTSRWKLFLEKFEDPIIIILLIAMVLSLLSACYEYFVTKTDPTGAGFFEPVGVFLAILLSTGIAFYFELKSEKEFELLSQVGDEVRYKVMRDGEIIQIPKREIVVGDLLYLETGEEIPADAELLEAVTLSVDESTLTGEPMTTKSVRPEDQDSEATYPTNYICRGTTILEGHAVCRVQVVGDATEQGKIFEGIQIDASVETPLNRQLDHLGNLIARISYILAALVLVGSTLIYAHDGGFAAPWDATLSYFLGKIMLAVTVIVVAVPEGLPMSVSLSLAYSMRSMMRSNNLVRRMHACETMGAITVICTDKTGTLTTGSMELARVVGAPGVPEGLARRAAPAVARSNSGDQNATSAAVCAWADAEGVAEEPVARSVPFDSSRKLSGCVLEGGEAFVMGATPFVLGRERAAALDDVRVDPMERVLVVCSCDGFDVRGLPVGEPRLLGQVVLRDELRPSAADTMSYFVAQGVELIVISGDDAATASAIAARAGVPRAGAAVDASGLDDETLGQRPAPRSASRGDVHGPQDLVPDRHGGDALADGVDDARVVAPHALGPLRAVAPHHAGDDLPVHGVETHRLDRHTHLPGPGHGLGGLDHLHDLGATEASVLNHSNHRNTLALVAASRRAHDASGHLL